MGEVSFPSNAITWDGLLNKPDVPEGVTSEQYMQQMNTFIGEIAETQFNAGLALLDYKDGQYWIYETGASDSGISSKTNTVLNSGKAELGVSSWNQTSSSAVSPSATTNWSPVSNYDFTPSKDGIIKALGFDGYNSATVTADIVRKSDSTVIASASATGTGATYITFSASDYSERLKSGTAYQIQYSISGNIAVYENGAGESYSTSEYTMSYTGSDHSIATNSGSFDIVRYATDKVFNSSGTITYGSKTYSNTPQTIVLSDDATLNGQGRTYTVKDGTGSTVATISDADIDNEMSITPADSTLQVEGSMTSDGTATPQIQKTELAVNY